MALGLALGWLLAWPWLALGLALGWPTVSVFQGSFCAPNSSISGLDGVRFRIAVRQTCLFLRKDLLNVV